MKSITIKEIKVGDFAFYEKTITDEDVRLFAKLTGDMNPVHLDEAFAKTSIFGKRVCHGGLVNALFSTVLGTEFPGTGTIYMSQDSRFMKPVYLNDRIKAVVEAIEINEEKNRVVMKTTAYNQHNEVVVTGTAMVMPPR